MTYLDAVRAIAALIVVIGHVRGLFFVAVPAAYTPASKLFYSIAARGHDSVMMFFVLSGLLITYSAARVFQARSIGWRHYAVARLSRLYMVLIPALLLGMGWDMLGLHWFGGGYGTDTIPVAARQTVAGFFGNLFFLQEILVPSFGSNQPLWSLAYEAWYYLMFPLGVVAVLGNGKPLLRVCAAVMLVACLCFVGWKISGYFLIWLSGSALFFLPAPRALSARCITIARHASLVMTIAAIFIIRKKLFPLDEAGWAPDMLVGLMMALHLYLVLHSAAQPIGWVKKLASKAAAFSFTLYVCHYPFLLFVSFVVLKSGPWVPDMQHMPLALPIVLVAVVYSMLIARVFEAKTPWLNAQLLRLSVGRKWWR